MKVDEGRPIPEICANCRFWAKRIQKEVESDIGACNRYPPQMILTDEDALLCFRPQTEWSDSCGEYRTRIDAQDGGL